VSGLEPFIVPPGEGTPIWYRGTLMTVKAGAEATGGALTIIEHTLPAGFAAPPHVHHAEDEPWYVLEGHVRFFCQDQTFDAEPGTFIFLPKDLAHSFRVDASASARMLLIGIPAGIEQYFAEAGEPALERTLPPAAGPADIERLRALARHYELEILGGPTPQ
jgi:mannose-6-phosphate isomerase-like protein (cupin superfamily)